MDPASPAARLAKMMEACESRCILAGRSTLGILKQLLSLQVLGDMPRIGWMDDSPPPAEIETAFSWTDLPAFASSPVPARNTAGDAAHMLFTSGSTGTPKGVVITHSNVLHFLEWANGYFGMNAEDKNSCHSPMHFDLSTFDIHGSFYSGSELHLLLPRLSLLPHKLAEYVRESKLTQWFSVPSILKYMAQYDVAQVGDFPCLKRLLWCGEAMPTPTLMYWMKRLPHVTFTNLYGPTEATIASSYYTVPECPSDERAETPIGQACGGEELIVLNDVGEPAGTGEIGDLYIRGAGLSPGYWRDPAKTQSVFLPNPNGASSGDRIYKTGDLARVEGDGLVYLTGRADSQIKSRGHRIELGEIETALSALGLLRESAVVAIETEGFEGKLICCAYVAAVDGNAAVPALQQKLGALLPAYMMPARWMPLEKLPLNGNGKIDRRSLAEMFRGQNVGGAV
jgi:amino acid adenylation domain-containing protein